MQCTRGFRQRGTRGEDVIDDDAAGPRNRAAGAPPHRHGAPDASCPVTPVEAFLAARRPDTSGGGLGQDVLHNGAGKLPDCLGKEQVHGAEPPCQIGGGTGGNRNKDNMLAVSGCRPHRVCERPAKALPEPVLAVALEGQQSLREFFPVDAGRNHGQQDPSVHICQRGRGSFGTERFSSEPAYLPGAVRAKLVVLGAAAHTVRRDGQSQKVGCGSDHLVGIPQEDAPVF